MKQNLFYTIAKTSCMSLVMAFVPHGIFAQTPLTVSQKQCQQVVRKAYGEAQAYAEQQKKDKYAGNVVTTKWGRIEPAVGRVEETIEFFSDAKQDEKTEMQYHSLRLVRVNCKRPEASIGDVYEEYLFDTDTEKLLFYYRTNKNWWCGEEVKVETRCYYNADGSYNSGSVKLTPIQGQNESYYPEELQELDGNGALRSQERYKMIFDATANFTME